MENANQRFAERLRAAMQKSGYQPKPAVLEREFNLRYWGKPMTLHGVRRWLLGQTFPKQDKLETLAEWLMVTPQHLRFGDDIGKRIERRSRRWDDAVFYRERETFEAFINLPAQQRKIVKEVILAFVQSTQTQSADSRPLFNLRAGE